VLCWAAGAEKSYSDFFCAALFDEHRDTYTQDDIRSIVARLVDGKPCEEVNLKPDMQFYVLGISPNAARLSIRFFYRDTFGNLMKNVNDHHLRMEIVKPNKDPREFLSLWAAMNETVNQKSSDKKPNSVMAGATARAIFSGSMYPASLIEAVMLRIRAEREITRGRAAIIKAYYLKNENSGCPKEVLTVGLNENSTNIPYTLGRLFSVLEALQEKANPGLNTTIKDKYYNSASASPAMIFPILDNLAQKHLRKLDQGAKIYYDKQIMDLKGILGEEYPSRLTLAEQGSFNLGYYHQTQKRYEKKEEK